MKTIVLGGGCFWCLEAVFQRVRGVSKVISGYSGGHQENPDYKSVCREETSHAEVVLIEFDESVISVESLLEIFFTIHDPTTLNRQGNDIGTQYRSAIYFSDSEYQNVIESFIREKSDDFESPIVTEVKPLDKFWPAESYHMDYYNNNVNQPYCQIVVGSKVAKLKQYFEDRLKES
ncbi:peptide-methionine (S)-S-oxide reductase MsrA [Pleionea sediminis]|uniref:peptide-methionine (S)-S-oxide reductase MsrA n=1 Tax=Pleionea sediminis TaxID=2569479 RepID=UPI001184CE25|nr:peptide-methionine (S)-S-oxide reductase MsrA [Pleionea sediminis]